MPTPTRRAVVAGGSGFLGVSLAMHLAAQNWNVTILSRRSPPISGPWQHVAWDARQTGPWCSELSGADALINLTGRSVDCRKTPDHCDEILRSRVESTRALGRAMKSLENPPPVWIQMSTAHIYGDPPEVWCDEDSPTGLGLAPDVGRAWEQEFHSHLQPRQRGVVLRTSFVIGRNRGVGGGALARLKLLARLGLGGTVGSGNQGLSWLHETDMHRLIERCLTDDAMQGTYIASSPHPVSQREFMRTLRRAMGIFIGLPATEWMVRIGAPLLMQTDPELALYGRYVVSRRLEQAGFVFQFPTLKAALFDALSTG